MPPKGVDKSKQKQAVKVAEDKTFGLKNKNKSKAVQKYIKQITNNAMGAPKGGKEEQERKEKDAQQKEIAKKALMNSLFNMATDKRGRAFDPAAKKQAKQQEEEAIAAGKKLDEKLRKEIIEGIANSIRLTNSKGIRMSELGGHPIIQALKEKHADTFKILSLLLFIKANHEVFWLEDRDSSNPIMRMQEDVDAEVAPDDRAIEEIIEEKRAALPPGGTPVTLETFKAWSEKKKAEKLAKEEEERQKAIKKSAGKAITGLSGRDLFTFDASLFIDDEEAAGDDIFANRQEDPDFEEEEKPDDDDDDDDDDDAEEGGEAAGSSGARGSGDAPDADGEEARGSKEGVEVNEELFAGGDDDDLDDLDDDDEGDKKES